MDRLRLINFRNLDIRDTVKFKEVMKQYGFGPNGAIMTSLNFFASQFNKVVDLIHKNSSKVSYVVLDTPGQIEVFTWSASGTIISESLGSAFPTIVIYVMDTPRSHNPVTFMSNMLYACSVLYRMQLPFLVVLNKTDIIDCGFAIEWMRDFEAFQDALAGSRSTDGPIELEMDSGSGNSGTSPYMTSLINSMSLVLDEFYNELRCCGVSSITGEGMDKLLQEINLATNEYHEVYVPMLRNRRSSRKAAKGEQGGTKTALSSRIPKKRNDCGWYAKCPYISGVLQVWLDRFKSVSFRSCSARDLASRASEQSLLTECSHEDSEVTTAKLAMGPLGPGRPKRSKHTRHMLVDMAGDNDEAEDDALVELDGLEQRDSSESDELEDVIDGSMDFTHQSMACQSCELLTYISRFIYDNVFKHPFATVDRIHEGTLTGMVNAEDTMPEGVTVEGWPPLRIGDKEQRTLRLCECRTDTPNIAQCVAGVQKPPYHANVTINNRNWKNTTSGNKQTVQKRGVKMWFAELGYQMNHQCTAVWESLYTVIGITANQVLSSVNK
ncbi:xpa-binding protein 1 [Clonorchis sinensis]|uniref:Xpa-binding protein 1 n=1 Tax=Clonorchis sinensis TaxID=79923 RepID=G7Y427_CLOSI|nr:xpa-binding protein 1 [Clonorchis sinensis]